MNKDTSKSTEKAPTETLHARARAQHEADAKALKVAEAKRQELHAARVKKAKAKK